ncbi:MAG TPA: acyltransferase, partial [Acidimicrobiales bacterium]|nr:acyltransferase [Acidimicrobiales bacterium]
HMASLDGLRCLSILAVLWHHGPHGNFAPATRGFLGVDLFFVLSGFLITTLLLEERDRFGAVDLPKFYARRALRLLPSLYLVLGVFALISLAWAHIDWEQFVSAGFYFANLHPVVFGRDSDQSFFLHTWSLSLEEQFYLVWPLVVRKLHSPQVAAALGIGLIVAAFVSRSLVDEAYDLFTFPLFSFDGFAVGAFLALALRSGRGLGTLQHPLVVLGAAGVMAVDVVANARHPSALLPVRVLVSELAVAVVVLFLVAGPEGPVRRLLRSRPFVYVGLLSYALYLWHFPVFELLTEARAPELWRPLRHVLKFAVTFAAAAFTYHVVDPPFTRWRQRVRPGGAPEAPAAAGATGTGRTSSTAPPPPDEQR